MAPTEAVRFRIMPRRSRQRVAFRVGDLGALLLYFAAVEAGGFGRIFSQGSIGFMLLLLGIFFSADLYAFSRACFARASSCTKASLRQSVGVTIGGLSIVWAEAVPINRALIATAWMSLHSTFRPKCSILPISRYSAQATRRHYLPYLN
jgi:hypothetical protein